MRNVFLTAEEARQGAVNNQIIYNEIRDIEKEILSAIAKGNYSVSINDTYMTGKPSSSVVQEDDNGVPYIPVETAGTGENYFRVWNCLDCGVETSYDKDALRDQMDKVIFHFKDLGYVMDRRITSDSDTTFYWKIMW